MDERDAGRGTGEGAVAAWDGVLHKDSTAAAIYTTVRPFLTDRQPRGPAPAAPTGGLGADDPAGRRDTHQSRG